MMWGEFWPPRPLTLTLYIYIKKGVGGREGGGRLLSSSQLFTW